MAWAKEQADIETLRYKEDDECKTVLIPFHPDRQLDYGKHWPWPASFRQVA